MPKDKGPFLLSEWKSRRIPWKVKLAFVIAAIPVLVLLIALIWAGIQEPLELLLVLSFPTAFFGFMWAAITLSDWYDDRHNEV